MLGRQFRLGESRGGVIRDEHWTPRIVATAHPSAILRMPTHEEREWEFKAFLADLRVAKKVADSF